MSPISMGEAIPVAEFNVRFKRTIERKVAVFGRKIQRLLDADPAGMPLMLVGLREFERLDYPMDSREQFVGIVGESVATLVWGPRGEPHVDFFVLEMLQKQLVERLEGA